MEFRPIAQRMYEYKSEGSWSFFLLHRPRIDLIETKRIGEHPGNRHWKRVFSILAVRSRPRHYFSFLLAVFLEASIFSAFLGEPPVVSLSLNRQKISYYFADRSVRREINLCEANWKWKRPLLCMRQPSNRFLSNDRAPVSAPLTRSRCDVSRSW